jgi:hypothetical protein
VNDRTPGNGNCICSQQQPVSPAYKTVRALKLFYCPFTEKTVFEKCSIYTPATLAHRSSLFSKTAKPKGVACACPKFDKPSENMNPYNPNNLQFMPKKRARPEGNRVE